MKIAFIYDVVYLVKSEKRIYEIGKRLDDKKVTTV